MRSSKNIKYYKPHPSNVTPLSKEVTFNPKSVSLEAVAYLDVDKVNAVLDLSHQTRHVANAFIHACSSRLIDLERLAMLIPTIPFDVWYCIFTHLKGDETALNAVSWTCSTWRHVMRIHYRAFYPPPCSFLMNEWAMWYAGNTEWTNSDCVYDSEMPFEARHLFLLNTQSNSKARLLIRLYQMSFSSKLVERIQTTVLAHDNLWCKQLSEAKLMFNDSGCTMNWYKAGICKDNLDMSVRFIMTRTFDFGPATCVGLHIVLPPITSSLMTLDSRVQLLKSCGVGQMEVTLSDASSKKFSFIVSL